MVDFAGLVTVVKMLSVNPAIAYHVTRAINEIRAQFMLNTGADVSVLQADIWNKIALVVNTIL